MNVDVSSSGSPRTYRLGKRATAAQATRDGILHAARRLAAETGFAALTVDGVAQEAGVSRLTVYNHFVSKSGLLEALAWSIFASADIEKVREARHHPEVRVALRSFVSENVAFLATIGDHGRTVLAAAMVDPDLAEVIDATYIAGRRHAITELVARIQEAGRLRGGWTSERAVASLMVLTSLESYETLVRHSGLTTTDAGSLLADLAEVLVRR